MEDTKLKECRATLECSYPVNNLSQSTQSTRLTTEYYFVRQDLNAVVRWIISLNMQTFFLECSTEYANEVAVS
jgi:hypothetical protein